jgi:hypothetical protein
MVARSRPLAWERRGARPERRAGRKRDQGAVSAGWVGEEEEARRRSMWEASWWSRVEAWCWRWGRERESRRGESGRRACRQ